MDEKIDLAVKVHYKDLSIHYIGIGSSHAPDSVLVMFTKLAARFAELGFCLRTQAVTEANRAFFKGARSKSGGVKVYLPWLTGNQQDLSLFVTPTAEGYANAERKTCGYEKLHKTQKDIRACTENLIYGPDTETPASFVICWSNDGAESFREISDLTGEIKLLLDLKPHWYIPVFNFKNSDSLDRLTKYISELKNEIITQKPFHHPSQEQIESIAASYSKYGPAKIIC